MKKSKEEIEKIFTNTNESGDSKGDEGKALWNFEEHDKEGEAVS
jgi:hypothetical protein